MIDTENKNNESITSEEEVKDFIWILNHTPREYIYYGEENFETHPIWPLESFRWDDQLNLYRREVMYQIAYFTSFCQSTIWARKITKEIVEEKLKVISRNFSQICSPEHHNLWQDLESMYMDEDSNENLDRLYCKCQQLSDATMPQIIGKKDSIRNEIYYYASFLVYLLGTIQTGLDYRFPNVEQFMTLGSQLIKNTPATTPYRKIRVNGAWSDLERIVEKNRMII